MLKITNILNKKNMTAILLSRNHPATFSVLTVSFTYYWTFRLFFALINNMMMNIFTSNFLAEFLVIKLN